jgi:hypothetical protein
MSDFFIIKPSYFDYFTMSVYFPLLLQFQIIILILKKNLELPMKRLQFLVKSNTYAVGHLTINDCSLKIRQNNFDIPVKVDLEK